MINENELPFGSDEENEDIYFEEIENEEEEKFLSETEDTAEKTYEGCIPF